MEPYQAIYDAVRSKISNGDIGYAVKQAIESADIGFYFRQACVSIEMAGAEMQRPSVLFKPEINRDGNQWCVLYGVNLMEGVAGFGDTPEKAMKDFDKQWGEKNPDLLTSGGERDLSTKTTV